MAAIPPGAFPAISWDNKLGALLIGGLISGILYGVTCTQTYVYFEKKMGDGRLLRAMVAVLWVLDTLDIALNSHLLYWYLVTNYTNPLALAGKPAWSLLLHVLVTSVTDFLVRGLFARRIWRLSNQNIVLTAGIFATSLLDLVVGIIIVAKGFSLQSLENLSDISTLFYINFAAGTASDIYVAVVLCYFLQRSRTGFHGTDSMINVLMLYTINTGLLTAVDAALGMILYITMPDNFIFIAFYLQLSKLYVNAYLATLNNRESLREKSSGEGGVSIHLSQMTQSRSGTERDQRSVLRSQDAKHMDPLAIMVDTQVDRRGDVRSKFSVSENV